MSLHNLPYIYNKKKYMVIYKTTNLINGKIYIGQNTNNDEKYLGSGFLITKAIKKYGVENFKKEIIEECQSKDVLNDREKFWIKFFNSTDKNIGYNISEGGTGGKLVPVEGKKGKTYEEYYGVDRANEIKQKLSEKRKGHKPPLKNITIEEVGRKISESLKGQIISDDRRKKVSGTLKEYFKTEEGLKQIKKFSEGRKGFKQSDESNVKRSNSLKGKRPKILDVHPSAKYWYFYDKENNLIVEILGNRTKKLKELGTNQRRIVIFTNLEECLKYNLPDNKDFKIFTKKYYIKDNE